MPKGVILTPRRSLVVEHVRLDVPTPATLELVNRQALRTLTAEDVHVRRTFVINDGVDTYWSRFVPDSITEVARKSPGAPVLVAHGEHDLEERARVFAGERVKRDVPPARYSMVADVGEGWWGALDFYWMRGHSRAEDLALEIDGGIRRETSLRWRFGEPRCSVCTSDMRECEHMPGEKYGEQRAWYDMYGIESVREFSFVPRGGQLNTSLELLRAAGGTKPAAEAVDAFLKELHVRVADEERDGLIEFARCYDPTVKLAKKDRARGWFDSLPKRTRGVTWWFNTSEPGT